MRDDIDHQPVPVEPQIGHRRADELPHGAVGSVAAHHIPRGQGQIVAPRIDCPHVDVVTDGAQRVHGDATALVDRRDRTDSLLQQRFEVRLGESAHLRVARGRVQRVAGLAQQLPVGTFEHELLAGLSPRFQQAVQSRPQPEGVQDAQHIVGQRDRAGQRIRPLPALQDDDPQAVLRQQQGGDLADRSGADHQHVAVAAAHPSGPKNARPA